MALVPKEIDDRITALEESNVLLEERLALVEEALAPTPIDPEVHTAMMKEAVLDKNQEWVIPKEEEKKDSPVDLTGKVVSQTKAKHVQPTKKLK